MHGINGKCFDDSIKIEDHKIKIRWGSAAASDLFFYLYRITGDDVF